MKVEPALIDACYRQLINKDFHVDESGITYSISKADLALFRSAGEYKLKRAMKVALMQKTFEDAREIYGNQAVQAISEERRD